jgi:hypothetical protein
MVLAQVSTSVGIHTTLIAYLEGAERICSRQPGYGVGGGPAFYAMPGHGWVPLVVRPELASWDRAGTPSQERLAAYLDQAKGFVKPILAEAPGPLALRLDIGLPQAVPLLNEHDLDNYLFPLVTALDRPTGSPSRLVTVWAHKRHAAESFLNVTSARPVADRQDWATRMDVVTTASAASKAFKEQIHRQLKGVHELPAGALTVEIGYVTGTRRYWPNLWKPTIDALDPILGRTRPDRPWHPQDGRIVTLGLHHAVASELGNDVKIAVRAAPAFP